MNRSFQLRIHGALGLLLSLGAAAMLGLATLVPSWLLARFPALAGMGFDTAAGIALAGSVLWMPIEDERQSRYGTAIGILLCLTGSLYLAHFRGLVAEPFSGFIGPVVGGFPWPGRLSPATAVSFLLLGMVLVLERPSVSPTKLLFMQFALAVVATLSVMAGFGDILGVDLFLGGVSEFSLMSWPTALCLLLLALGFAGRMSAGNSFQALYVGREDRRAFALGALLLYCSIMAAGMGAVGLVATQTRQAMLAVLQARVGENAAALDIALSDALARAVDSVDRSRFAEALATANSVQRRAALRRELEQAAAALSGEGAVAMRLSDAAGRVLAGRGDEDGAATWPQIPLRLPHGAMLSVHDGLWLNLAIDIADAGRLPARVRIRWRLMPIEGQLRRMASPGRMSEFLVCARIRPGAADCISSRSVPVGMPLRPIRDGSRSPTQLALDGQAGVTTLPDGRGASLIVAYAPIANAGLSMVQTIDAGEFYQPLRERLLGALATLLALAVLGVALLYKGVYPIIRRLDFTKSQFARILDKLPEAVITIDTEGTVHNANAATQALSGYSPAELIGRKLDQLMPESARQQHSAYLSGELKSEAARVIGAGPREMTALHRDGGQFPIEISVSEFLFQGQRLFVTVARDLRERKRVEESLGKWQRVFALAGWGVAVNGVAATTLEEINPAYARMHGYSVAELTGRDIFEVLAPQARAEHSANIARSHEVGHRRFESLHVHRDGHVFPVLVDVTTVRSPSGEPLYRITNVQDITASREIQEEMRISREFFQSAFDAASIGMTICSIEGRYLSVNRAMCQIAGYSEEELLAMSFDQITHPDDLERNAELHRDLVSGRIPSFQLEKRLIRGDGPAIWVLLAVSLVSDKEGKPLYGIGQILDIDRQRQTESALRASRASLANAQRIARLGDWDRDLRLNTVSWSDETYRIFGMVPESYVPSPEAFFAIVHPDDLDRLKTTLNEAISRHTLLNIDHRIMLPDGAERIVHSQGEVLFGPDGSALRMVGTVQDITERKRDEQALLKSRQQLRAMSAHQEGLLEDERKHIAREVHDELGQLLTALKMDISLLRLRFGDDAALQSKIEEMRALVERTIDVVRHVASNLRPAALDHGILPAIEWLAEDFSHRWEMPCRVAVQGRDVVLDDVQATAVFRVVQESLTNVARHAHATEVAITLGGGDRGLELRVQDNGGGFDPAVVRKVQGFGLLGMRERVLALGGSLKIDSVLGRGTSVVIELPLASGRQP